MNLRDHDAPCQHDWRTKSHDPDDGRLFVWCCDVNGCPGGAAVSIDYEAAANESANSRPAIGPVTDRLRVQRIVDAALGLTDEPD